MRLLRASRGIDRAGVPTPAPAPAPSPAHSQGTLGVVLDIVGHAISIVITLASIPRVWRLRQVPISADDSHLVPLLQNPNNHLAARRVQAWLVAYLVHSLTLILHKYKVIFLPGDMGLWRLFSQCPSPFFALIVSAVLLGILVWHYPISEDLCFTGVIIAFGCIGYVLAVLTDMIYLESTITLEIVLIPITLCMQTLRLASQDTSTQFERIPFTVAVLGVVSGTLVLIPPSGGFWEHVMQSPALHIATLLGAIFRLVDAISIWCIATTTGDAINYFRSRLHECFL